MLHVAAQRSAPRDGPRRTYVRGRWVASVWWAKRNVPTRTTPSWAKSTTFAYPTLATNFADTLFRFLRELLTGLFALSIACCGYAAEPNDDFQLTPGASISVGPLTVTAVGGFRGFKRMQDAHGEVLVFVRDGTKPGEYAVIVLQRRINLAASLAGRQTKRDALAYVTLGLDLGELSKAGWIMDDPLTPDHKWTADGVDFFYGSALGTGQNKDRFETLVYATVGEDLFSFGLQAPLSMRQSSNEALNELVKTTRHVGSK